VSPAIGAIEFQAAVESQRTSRGYLLVGARRAFSGRQSAWPARSWWRRARRPKSGAASGKPLRQFWVRLRV